MMMMMMTPAVCDVAVQMLKAGSVKCKPGYEAWPRPVKPVSSQSRECQNNNSDADDYQQVPRYEASLSDAIQAALDSYDQTSGMHTIH